MSEPTDLHIWKYRRQISSSNNRRTSCIFLQNFYARQQRGKIQFHQQGRSNRRRRNLLTFPLNIKLNFYRLGKRRNSLATGHTSVSKPYLYSVKKRSFSEAGSNTGIDIQKFKQKMANTLSVMTNVLRNVVSKQRIRYKENGFNLDLAYVCDNIIAMGYPAEKYESMYRNRLEDVFKFLEENHRDHYKIYNLCLERSYDINKFHGRVSVYPFEDHNPPTIELIQKFCEDVDSWLKADNHNVAAVHCKAGKGRTGTMICCYLLFSGKQPTAEDALSCYDEKRTKDRKGVTIPSQRRYVQYFSKLISSGLRYERRNLQFCEIRFSEPNTMQCFGIVHCSISVLQDVGSTLKVQPLQQNLTIDFRKTCVLDMTNPAFTVAGDIKVELTKNSKKLLHFWFNTFFVADSAVLEGEGNDVKYVYTLHKWEIDDAHKDKEHKCFSEDFKVGLVFRIDDNSVVHDQMQVSNSNRLMSNQHRAASQCLATNERLSHPALKSAAVLASTIQSNNYSLPQNSSSGSEMNFLCDQKSSSSTSVSSSLGGGGSSGGITADNSNGLDSNVQQHRSGGNPQAHLNNSDHSHTFVAMPNTNNVLGNQTLAPQKQHQSTINFTPAATAIAMGKQQTPPGYMMEHQYQLQPQNQQLKTNVLHLQQHIKDGSAVAVTSTPNHRHMHRQNLENVGCVAAGSDMVSNAKPSGNVSSSNTYNHSTDSSKTSSVSSQSSSAIGDTEEDWESGESCTKQLDHITLLLSTSFVTTNNSPASPQKILPPHKNTTSFNMPLLKKDPLRSEEKYNSSSIQHSSSFTSTSNSTSTSTSFSSSSFFSCTKCPNTKCNTSSSSCSNRIIVGGDDDDDNVDDNNAYFNDKDNDKTHKYHKHEEANYCDNKDIPVDNDNKCKQKQEQKFSQAQSKIEVKHEDLQTSMTLAGCTSQPVRGVMNSNGDNSYSQNKTDSVPSPPVPAHTRPKLMHMLMAPKSNNSGGVIQHTHKPIFKRKSSYKLIKNTSNVAEAHANPSASSHDCNAVVTDSENSGGPAITNFGGVATTSKQKLKIKLKKNKLKLSQKFQWFQSYFRSDPVDFCENFVQQTTSMRRNSICSMASRTHKLSTTTPPSITPPPLPMALPAAEGSSSSEQLNDQGGATSVSQSTSNASIATGDLCEDYYSYICDNQLSFSNSPCKSPRSMADIASSINGNGGGAVVSGGSFGSSFVRSVGGHYRERRETMPGVRRSNNVVIVAAKPAKTHAIGFNVNSMGALNFEQKPPPLARHDSVDIDASPASIYYTPDSQSHNVARSNDSTGFMFPTSETSSQLPPPVSEESNITEPNSLDKKPQSKYSLNLVIVKECPFEAFTKPGYGSDTEQFQASLADSHTIDASSALPTDEFLERKVKITACESVCSNSSSSGFGTSECCTTNSSSSSCNCNPFAAVLERHATTNEQTEEPKAEDVTQNNAIFSAEAIGRSHCSLYSGESKDDLSKTVTKNDY